VFVSIASEHARAVQTAMCLLSHCLLRLTPTCHQGTASTPFSFLCNSSRPCSRRSCFPSGRTLVQVSVRTPLILTDFCAVDAPIEVCTTLISVRLSPDDNFLCNAHLHGFCATAVSSGLATRATLIRVSRVGTFGEPVVWWVVPDCCRAAF
jgi:hypothetical protein